MRMDDCIFCKIGTHEIPKKPEDIKYEDDNFIAFLDIHPKAAGHTILIPKAHSCWFVDMPQAEWSGLMTTAQTISKNIKTEYEADFVRLGIVGTDVPHVHVHLIPQKIHETEPKI